MKPKTWTHPKFADLQCGLGIGPAFAAGILDGLWHLVATFEEETGKVPFTGRQLEAWLKTGLDGEFIVACLVESGWLELRDDVLYVHDWLDHRPGYVNDRIRKRNVRDIPGHSRKVQENLDAAPPSPCPSPCPSPSTRSTDQARAGTDGRIPVDSETIAQQADGIFTACKYSGDKGGNLWGVAALMETGIGDISEAEVFSAARGAALNGRDKPAHFFTCLAESIGKRGLDLRELLRQVTITPTWPKTKPYKEVAR